ncbi:hypothetical protein [Nostoc punctiforme]|nr:hypothetical protein [Nostoc punctiforme]
MRDSKGLPTKKTSHRFGEQGKQGALALQERKNLVIIVAPKIE